MRKNRFFIVVVMSFAASLFVGCASMMFEDNYVSNVNVSDYPSSFFLQKGEEPKIIRTENIEECVQNLRSEYYEILGTSSFNDEEYGDGAIQDALQKIAVEQGAVAVAYCKKYNKTRTGSYTTPNTHYYYATDIYGNRDSYKITTYETTYYNYDIYNYTAVFLFRISPDYYDIFRPGLVVREMANYDRKTLKRNTGALVNNVLKDSPAFRANILVNDIIVKANGNEILNDTDFTSFMKNIHSGDKLSLVVFRDGKEIPITFISN